MKRLVAYIYGYKNGIKGRNAGFGKIDTKDNDMKMNITLRYDGAPKNLKVYFFVKEDGKTYGIYLGNMERKMSEYELKRAINIKELTHNKYEAKDIYGIVIKCDEEVKYVSFWQTEYHIDKVQDMEEWGEKGNIRKNKNINDNEDLEARSEENEEGNEKKEIDLEKDNKNKETSLEKEDNNRNLLHTEEHKGIEVEEEDTIYLIDTDCTPVNDSFVAKQIELKSTSILHNMKNKPIKNIEIKGKTCSICEIYPKEIYDLPKGCWELGRNTFVCHGFIKYGRLHLIECDEIYLAVPGYQSTNENIVAKRYGFDIFLETETECLKQSSCNKWKRGYWCKKLIV